MDSLLFRFVSLLEEGGDITFRLRGGGGGGGGGLFGLLIPGLRVLSFNRGGGGGGGGFRVDPEGGLGGGGGGLAIMFC